jgi:Dolichyl-phosphate-mannose-protein mannosyltransferase
MNPATATAASTGKRTGGGNKTALLAGLGQTEAREPRVPNGAMAMAARVAMLFICALLVQYGSGAFGNTTRPDNADEPAHIVTGMMVHDYLAHGLGQAPMAFAREYYVHYPKVALGHWPPLFYAVQGVWMLVFPATRDWLLVLIALLGAVASAQLYALVRPIAGACAAACASVLLLTLPATADLGSQVMTEVPMSVVLLGGALAFGRYMDTGRWQCALAFALWGGAAMLTKGTGIALALVPILAAAIAGRWELLARRWYWAPAGIVVALAGPWYLLAPSALHERTAAFGAPGLAVKRMIPPPFSWAGEVGWVVSIAALAGLIWVVLRARDRGRYADVPGGELVAAAALVVSATVFPMFFHAWETRHLVEAAPALLAMAVVGVAWLGRTGATQAWFPSFRLSSFTPRAMNIAIIAGTAVLIGWNVGHLSRPVPSGYGALAQDLLSGGAPKVMLIAADGAGEGALIAEVARREQRPASYVLRATKTLAEMDWMGRRARERFDSAAGIQAFLAGLPVDVVVLDRARPAPFAYTAKLEQAVAGDTEHWRARSAGGRFEIFDRMQPVAMDSRQAQQLLREVGAPPIGALER